MEKSRPRRPDKALYVPKARRITSDAENGGQENPAAQIASSANNTPVQSRHRNEEGDSLSRVQEHRENVDWKLSKSPAARKEAKRKDREPVYIVTGAAENDSLCEAANSLVVNENSLSLGSIESSVSASLIDPTAAVHSVSVSKGSEHVAAYGRSGSHRLGQQHENRRRESAESKEERDRARRNAQVKEKCQSRRSGTSTADSKRYGNMHSPSLARLPSSMEQVRSDVPSKSLHNSCVHKAQHIDNMTELENTFLFHNTDRAVVISTSDITKDPSGQLTVCSGNIDRVLLYDKQENIAEKQLDSCPVVIENVLVLTEGDNGANVCSNEPGCRAADEQSVDLKVCQFESTKGELDSRQTSELLVNRDTAHVRPQDVSKANRKGEIESEHSGSHLNDADMELEGRCCITNFESKRDRVDHDVSDIQGTETGSAVASADLLQVIAMAECPQEEVDTAESVPIVLVLSVESAVEIADCPQVPAVMHKQEMTTVGSVSSAGPEVTITECPQGPIVRIKEEVASTERIEASAQCTKVPAVVIKEEVASTEPVEASAQCTKVSAVVIKEEVASTEPVEASADCPQVPAVVIKVSAALSKEALATAVPVPAITPAEPLVLMEMVAIVEQVPPVVSTESLPALENTEPVLTGVCANSGIVCSEINTHNTGADCVPEESSASNSKDGQVRSHCVTSCQTPDENVSPSGVNADDDESWDSLFNDDGDCVDSQLLEELTLGERNQTSPQESRFNYYAYEPKESTMDDLELAHVIEIYDFPADFKTEDLFRAFASYQ
ncbi:coiled-coil domain-containing protein R3HCC1L isoform X2 [Mixophyes fleayi]